jgi:hypothetical protein
MQFSRIDLQRNDHVFDVKSAGVGALYKTEKVVRSSNVRQRKERQDICRNGTDGWQTEEEGWL